MKSLKEAAPELASIIGVSIKAILGNKAEFILIPIVDVGSVIEVAVISDIKSEEKLSLSFSRALAAMMDISESKSPKDKKEFH